MPLYFIFISAQFYQTKCSETQSTKKMEHWEVSVDEDERIWKDLARDGGWRKATRKGFQKNGGL